MKNEQIFTMSSRQHSPVSDEDMDDLEVGAAIEEAKNMTALKLVVEAVVHRLRTGQDPDGD
tara:strand:+ start:437 stop:619 length:183 start_codon:yes stop_codon:yes gene_type:complete